MCLFVAACLGWFIQNELNVKWHQFFSISLFNWVMWNSRNKIQIEITVDDRKKHKNNERITQLKVYGICVSSYEAYNETAKMMIIS